MPRKSVTALTALNVENATHSPIECVGNLNAVPNIQRFRQAGVRILPKPLSGTLPQPHPWPESVRLDENDAGGSNPFTPTILCRDAFLGQVLDFTLAGEHRVNGEETGSAPPPCREKRHDTKW